MERTYFLKVFGRARMADKSSAVSVTCLGGAGQAVEAEASHFAHICRYLQGPVSILCHLGKGDALG
jgi:hypothetical protein